MPADHGKKDFRIDFIDPLFAIAIHIGIVDGIMHQKWLEHRSVPTTLPEFANLMMFLAGFWTIVASWVGYHRSIQAKPIKGDVRFVLDIVLLALYIFLLLYFQTPSHIAVLMVLIYLVYIAWDYFKTKEYANVFYGGANPPNGPTYFCQCLTEWMCPGKHPTLVSESVTFGWAMFFLVALPFAWWPVATTDTGKIICALLVVAANYSYRYDKRSRGKIVRGIPFKWMMAAALVIAAADYARRF
jgi:hypothetical protein